MPKSSSSNGLVTANNDLAFKSAEIEELTDVYFFRPLGWFVARAARGTGITPGALTIIGMLVGVAGGALLYNQRLGLAAFAILILHSIIDSADGQLARMTSRVTDLGRVLDGLSGYATHVAIFLAIGFGLVHRGAPRSTFLWMLLAGIATAVHAGMYDYHRNAYAAVVTDGRVPTHRVPTVPAAIKPLVWLYFTIQRRLIVSHVRVESFLGDPVRDEERARYRDCFYLLVRGWNFLGDNTRFFAIGVLALVQRLDLFFAFVLGPMNLALVILWLWQRNADRRFLAGLSSSKLPAG
jgi:phosphatidylglycerophosphate synthase